MVEITINGHKLNATQIGIRREFLEPRFPEDHLRATDFRGEITLDIREVNMAAFESIFPAPRAVADISQGMMDVIRKLSPKSEVSFGDEIPLTPFIIVRRDYKRNRLHLVAKRR